MVIVKEYDIIIPKIRDSFHRRSILFQNKIVTALKKLGVDEDDIDIVMYMAAMKNLPAEVSWYFDGYLLSFKYAMASKFVENIFVIAKLLELEVNAVLAGKKSLEEFIDDFAEEENLKEQRKDARKVLGVADDCMDLAEITKKYKSLAKKHHPDMASGDLEIFKKINNAHKVLKFELA